MARQTIKIIADMSNRETKRQLQTAVGAMDGMYEVEIKPRRNTRSLRQNAYWWAVPVQCLYQFLRDQDYDCNSPEVAHEILKAKLLTAPIVNPVTGAIIGRRVRSTTTLTTEEMTDLIDRARAWMLDFFGIVTPDPSEYGIEHEAVKHG